MAPASTGADGADGWAGTAAGPPVGGSAPTGVAPPCRLNGGVEEAASALVSVAGSVLVLSTGVDAPARVTAAMTAAIET